MSFRLVVEETFNLRGRGTVVVGTLENGPVEPGEEVRMRLPDGSERAGTVAEISMRGRRVPRAEPGDRVGLLLRGAEPPPAGTIVESLDQVAPGRAPTLESVALGSGPTAGPLLLLPLRIETSFQGSSLRIRIYPDQIHVDSFDPRLTADEVAAGMAYLAALAAGRAHAEARADLADLAEILDPLRARLVAERADAQGATGLAEESQGGLEHRAVARGLPSKVIAHGISSGRGFTAEGREIPREVPVAPAQGDVAPPGHGSPLDWMKDFQTAEAMGLALTLELDDAAAREGLDWLYVFGVDGSGNGELLFLDLLRAHAGSDGLRLLAPLTPTKSGPREGPDWSVEGAIPDRLESLARALGLQEELPLSRPPRADPAGLVRDLAAIVWEAALRPALGQLYGADSHTLDRVREVFVERIRPFGPYPTLQVGSQPYATAPVAAPRTAHGDTLLSGLGDAIRAAMPAVAGAARESRDQARAPGGYRWMIDTLLRRPIGQHWRLRSLTAAEAYLTPLARAVGSADAAQATQSLAEAVRQGRVLLDDLGFDVDAHARVFTALGDDATPSICGPLVAPGAAGDRTGKRVADRGMEALTEQSRFWRDRISEADQESAYFEGSDGEAEPLLRLFAENAVLQVLSDLAVAEDLADERDRELVAAGALDPGADAIPPEAWHLRARLAAQVERLADASSLEDVAQRIRTSTPAGAERLSDLTVLARAIRRVNGASAAGTHAAFAALLDCLSTRADAWLVAEAEAALQNERSSGRQGVSLGGWGVLEEVRPGASGWSTRHMTAPSEEFATTLGLVERARRGLAASGLDGVIRAELSGPRVSEAREILGLLRQGRSISAALSRRLAEALNRAGRGPLMEAVIAALPPEGGAPGGFECDGLAFMEHPDLGRLPDVDRRDERLLEEVQADLRGGMEALGELRLVEGAAALSQRRVEAARATLSGLGAGTPPQADLSVLTPSSTGTTLDFAVAACIGEVEQSVGMQDLRARLAPALAALAERLLGPVQGQLHIQASAPIAMADLDLSALSLAHIAAPGSDAQDRLKAYVRAARGLPLEAEIHFDRAAHSTLWAAGRLAALLAEARALGPDDFPDEARVSADTRAMADRRREAEGVLSGLRRSMAEADATPVNAAELFAAGLIPAPASELLTDAAAAIDERLARARAASDDTTGLAQLMGDMPAFPFLRTADTRPWEDGPMLQGASRGELLVWLEETQTVRSRVEPLADLSLGAEHRDLAVRAAQWPPTLRPTPHQQVDWIGAELREDDVYAARSGMVIVGTDVAATSLFGGLFIDGWQEVVPDEFVTAGVVVDAATPPARPPQLLLLAVPGGDGDDWTPGAVLRTVKTAVAMGQMRTVGLGQLPRAIPRNGVLGLLGRILPVGAVRSTDTALSRAACAPEIEG